MSEIVQAYSLNQFLEQTGQKDLGQGVFELESERMLEINLNGRVWTKIGAMVAYKGQIKFEREGAFEGGVGKFLKKAFTGEMTVLSSATGQGKLYTADHGKHISIIRLEGQTLNVQGNDLLAFEDTISYDIHMIKKIAGMMAGGLFSVHLSGTGFVAITSHGRPLTLKCSASDPVMTDPNATVAWSGNLQPELKTDISLKTLFGRGGGESFQMQFRGDGFVVVQPYEEVYSAAQA